MIHFDFIVDDIDAENIMMCMQDSANRARDRMLDVASDKSNTEIERQRQVSWHREHVTYMEELISKMKNTRIGD